MLLFLSCLLLLYFCICCYWTNNIRSMMSLKRIGLTNVPLVRALFHCVLMIMLVVLVAWGLAFLYQQESIPNVIFLRLSFS